MAKMNFPRNFPHGCSDKELRDAVDVATQCVENGEYNINDVMRWSPVIQLGLFEVQSRFLKRREDEASRLNKWSIGLIAVSISVAIVQLVLALLAQF